MVTNYQNKNRGYQQLRVWGDAIDLYVLSWRVFRKFPFELKRVASQAISSSDSVHRNIAEGPGFSFFDRFPAGREPFPGISYRPKILSSVYC